MAAGESQVPKPIHGIREGILVGFGRSVVGVSFGILDRGIVLFGLN